MCGVVGVLELDGRPLGVEHEQVLLGMLAEIGYRGPDDRQLYRDGPIGLAFARLAINDEAGGRQPMRGEDGSVVAVANGEIYNHRELRAGLRGEHRFASGSDCEILPHLYEEDGPDLVPRLRGMFALAVWDARAGRLLLARDRFGVKPLFYTRQGSRLIFASEIKALLAHPDCPREVDWAQAVCDPAINGAVAANTGRPASYFRGITQLPAASTLVADTRDGSLREDVYWRLEFAETDTDATDDELVARCRDLLAAATTDCLMSDVEIGVLLSGGIDSALVAALAARGAEPHTFTVLSQSTLANEDARYAQLTAREFGLPNHQVLFRWEDSQWGPEQWRELLWLCETPLCGAEQMYKYELYRYAKQIRPGLKVMLTGQGSDEFNGGYSTLFTPPGEDGTAWPELLAELDAVRHNGLAARVPYLDAWEQQLLLPVFTPDFVAALAGDRPQDAWPAYIRTKYRDLQTYNCWHEDRTAAGNSVENRVPFLDHRLVELMVGIPPARGRRLLWDKTILRRAARDVLPRALCDRPKVPFFHGPDLRYTQRMMLALLAADSYALVEEALAAMPDVVDADAVFGVLARLADDPEAMGMEFLLRLVNLGLLQSMAVSRAAPAALPIALPRRSAVRVDDWDEAAIGLDLAVRREELTGQAVLTLAPDWVLARRADRGATGEWYLMNGQEGTHYVLAEDDAGAWLRVLSGMDGQTPLTELLVAAEATESDVRKLLAEAVDFGVVRVRPAVELGERVE
ncbi:asparagine synthase (glutamine-hydrolyzing) [Actinophytocola sediminis]